MKKLMGMVICGLLALSIVIAGCSAGGGSDASDAGQTVGGWGVNDQATVVVTPEEQALFEKALEGLTGVGYEPVAVLATQVVSGTNRAFLCKGTTVTAEPTTNWYVVVVYENLSGEASLVSIQQIDITAPKTSEDAMPADVVGGWSVVENAGVSLLPAEADEAFATAREGYVGVDLNPIAVLGTQLVSGTNYLVLCEGSAVVENPVACLYLVEVYANLDGGAEITNVATLDFLGYVTE